MIHIYCPTFPELQGTFSFDQIDYREVQSILTHGFERDSLGNDNPISSPAGEPQEQIVYHHTWPSVRALLNRSGFALTSQIDRRAVIQVAPKMEPGDTGIVFRPIQKAPLRDLSLTAADFMFIRVERIS